MFAASKIDRHWVSGNQGRSTIRARMRSPLVHGAIGAANATSQSHSTTC